MVSRQRCPPVGANAEEEMMGTKRKPGAYDCYDNAAPDEPMFVLLGRDERAPALVEAWADASEKKGTAPEKVVEARQCAAAMRAWRESLAKLHVFTDGEEYVIAKDEADARVVYEATGATPPDDVAFERCDPSKLFTILVDEDANVSETKTFGEWIKAKGRGYLCASMP